MSYILEALKKAEAERQADAARPAHLSAVLGTTRTPSRKADRQRRVAPAALVLLVVVAGAAWYSHDGAAPPTTQAKVEEQRAGPVPLAATPAAPVAAAPAAPVAEDPPVEPTAKPKEKTAKKAPQKKPSAVQDATDGTASASTADAPALPALRELPEQVQREIPAYSVGGYIYSGNRSDRSILINTRLLREGDEIAPGLTLEKMMPKEMVLNFKGYRYRAPY